MAHIPYGYKIEDGTAVIDKIASERVKKVFEHYMSGASLDKCSKESGINKSSCCIGRILQDEKYLGKGFYPKLIDDEIFDAAQLERMRRAVALGRVFEYPNGGGKTVLECKYKLGKVKDKYSDPYKQAEYAYSQIEREG